LPPSSTAFHICSQPASPHPFRFITAPTQYIYLSSPLNREGKQVSLLPSHLNPPPLHLFCCAGIRSSRLVVKRPPCNLVNQARVTHASPPLSPPRRAAGFYGVTGGNRGKRERFTLGNGRRDDNIWKLGGEKKAVS